FERKPVGQPPSKPPQRHLAPPRPSGPDPAAPASSRHQPQPVRRPCCCLEPPKTAGKRSSFGRFFNLSFSLIRPPNQSCEAPGFRPNSRRDLRRVQLARTSSRRRRKETTRANILAPAPPPKRRISLGDSAEFSAEV
ncbi:LRR and NB-ARC domains-containing disease resistance protein, partial [Prunus dulcis]